LIDLVRQWRNKKVSSPIKLGALAASGGDTLKSGGRIEIRGFGSFTVRKYKAYKGRNPRNGEHVDVKPKKAPFFKVGRELKKMVDGK
jgi:nucleoid DNA-binding protein